MKLKTVFLLFSASSLIIISCSSNSLNDKSDSGSTDTLPKETIEPASRPPIPPEFPYLSMNFSTFNKFYSKPKFKKFVLQIVTPDLSSGTGQMRLLCYAIDLSNDIIPDAGNPFFLAIITDSARKTFTGPGIYGNLELSRTKIEEILNGSTTFDHLIFEPDKPLFQLVYNVTMHPPSNAPQSTRIVTTDPSPPARASHFENLF